MPSPSPDDSIAVAVNGGVGSQDAAREANLRRAYLNVARTLPVLLRRLKELVELTVLGDPGGIQPSLTAQNITANILDAPSNCGVAVIPRTGHESRVARGPVLVAVDGDTASADALRWAFDEAVMRGVGLEVIQIIGPDLPSAEVSSRQRDLAELLADWRSDYPGLAVRIDVSRGDPTQVLIEASDDVAVLVLKLPYAAGLASWSISLLRSLLAISDCSVVLVPARNWQEQREKYISA